MRKSHQVLLASVIGGSLLAASAGVYAQQAAAKPETLIKWRQSVFQVIGWTCGRVKLALEAAVYDKDEVIKAATALAAVSNSGIGSLFAAGTEQGKGWHDTATKPEFFAAGSKAGEIAGNLARETNELVKVANTSDVAAVKAQFGKVTATCKACHDDYRIKL
ncbi:c-type cytochrome [Quatrionicoccus australiensis]|uniref:c-type cytochrome n=1 Tax=Quatrionicoccus australiensis TaxID=138118 RepID=UPI001CFB91DF|nr:cytochrome c [Quatrionicoccus australiensis]MCB4358836.1 cytochrome c [Quatrionicoccus australiensis]